MDGNGRWAKERGKNRLFGHKAGIEAVRETIRCASDVGVRYLTIYSFSSENWKRPQDEVIGLMNLFATTMLAEVDGLHEEHVRVMTIGRTDELPKKTRDAFAKAWEKTKDNDGMTLVVAVNYGGRVARGPRTRAFKRGDAVSPSVHRGHPRPRPAHPNQRRDARVELPAVADRLFRVRVHRDAVAGLRPLRVLARAAGVPVARSPVRGGEIGGAAARRKG